VQSVQQRIMHVLHAQFPWFIYLSSAILEMDTALAKSVALNLSLTLTNVSVSFFSPSKETLWDEIQLFKKHLKLSALQPDLEFRQSGFGIARFAFDTLQSNLNGSLIFRDVDNSGILLRSFNVSLANAPPPWYSSSIQSVDSTLTSSGGDVFVNGIFPYSFSVILCHIQQANKFYATLCTLAFKYNNSQFQVYFSPLLPYTNFYSLSVANLGFTPYLIFNHN